MEEGISTGKSPFDTDKSGLLAAVLDRFGCHYRSAHRGNQQVRCIDHQAHPGGDKRPSASANLGKGLYRCFACGLEGDGYALMMRLESMGVLDVNRTLRIGEAKQQEKSEYMF